jgi:hypothetical protein
VTSHPRDINDSASGIPSHPKPTIATFFIPLLLAFRCAELRLRQPTATDNFFGQYEMN